MAFKHDAERPRPDPGRGLLKEDRSDISLVPAKDRDWWEQLSEPAKARFAERHGKKWTDEETCQLIQADPDTDDYYQLAARMGRAPGALRLRRSYMIHILRDEYGYVAKAKRHAKDPKQHHKDADVGQVYRVLGELGILDLTVTEQWPLARHLRAPTASWRGDNSSAVLRERRVQAAELIERVAALRESAGRDRPQPDGAGP
jgi:hypothetical protein